MNQSENQPKMEISSNMRKNCIDFLHGSAVGTENLCIVSCENEVYMAIEIKNLHQEFVVIHNVSTVFKLTRQCLTCLFRICSSVFILLL
jgi:hypothetical protein